MATQTPNAMEEKYENELAKLAVDMCFRIHRLYGPGLLESVYEEFFVMS